MRHIKNVSRKIMYNEDKMDSPRWEPTHHTMRHINVVSRESIYDDNEVDPHWESSYDSDSDGLLSTSGCPRPLNFPRLSTKEQEDISVPAGFWPDETWSDVARFDRFRKYRDLPLELRRKVIYAYMRGKGHKSEPVKHLRSQLYPQRYDRYPKYPLYRPEDFPEVINVQYLTFGKYWDYDDLDEYRIAPMSTKFPSFLPSICLASKQLYLEATPIFISNVQWGIQSSQAEAWLTKFLGNFNINGSEDGLNSVRDVSFFDMYPWLGHCPDMQLASCFGGLKNLTLSFHGSRFKANTLGMAAKNFSEQVHQYGLEGIFGCRSLKKLRIIGLDKCWHPGRVEAATEEMMLDLADCIRRGFWHRHKQVVGVEVLWPNQYFEV